MNSQEDCRYWLALNRVSGVGPRTFISLLESFGSPAQVFAARESALRACNLTERSLQQILSPDWNRVDADMEWLAQPARHLLCLSDVLYPKRLSEIHDPPPVLFVHGDVEVLQTPQLAMVGSRNPSSGGERTAFAFAAEMAKYGISITSGLALGIDAASHRGVLSAEGITIAVMGTGLDWIYPAKHKELAEQIVENGALVSEFPPGTRAEAKNFPRRNRIISGLSLGTLVVEAALRSGSLISARHAMEQGREVFAIPGSIHNPMARGCHSIIRQGAKLVESVGDILEELSQVLPNKLEFVGTSSEKQATADESWFDEDYRSLLNTLAHESMSIDQLVQLSGLTANAVSSMLLVLELRDIVSSQPGGKYIRL
jgi:DNA processing protein